MNNEKAMIRVRVNPQDAHYGERLASGAFSLRLFGDVATELLIRLDGDEGLFLRYDEVEFIAPLYQGDYVEAVGWITAIGKTSRKMEFEAYRVVRHLNDSKKTSAADFLAKPELVCKAKGVCVTPSERQRKKHGNPNSSTKELQ